MDRTELDHAASQSFCSHCWADVSPSDRRCPGCETELDGGGQHAVVDGDKPSPLFRSLFVRERVEEHLIHGRELERLAA